MIIIIIMCIIKNKKNGYQPDSIWDIYVNNMEIKWTDIKSAITFRNEVILRPTGERQTRLAASLETCFDLKEIRFIGLNTFDISISKVYVLEKFYDRI